MLNDDEVSNDFSVTFGEIHKKPFRAESLVTRSAMSDGALSPEATRAFAIAASNTRFPINTGEDELNKNYFFTHKITPEPQKYLELYEGSGLQKSLYRLIRVFFNGAIAISYYRTTVLPQKARDTTILEQETLRFYSVNWEVPLEHFPRRHSRHHFPDRLRLLWSTRQSA